MRSFLGVYYQLPQTFSDQSLITSAYHCPAHLFAQLTLSSVPRYRDRVCWLRMCCVYGQIWKMERQWLKLPALGQVVKAALPENSSIPGVDVKNLFTTAFIPLALGPSTLLSNWWGQVFLTWWNGGRMRLTIHPSIQCRILTPTGDTPPQGSQHSQGAAMSILFLSGLEPREIGLFCSNILGLITVYESSTHKTTS